MSDETLIKIPAALITRAVGMLRESAGMIGAQGFDGHASAVLKFATHLELVASVAAVREGWD